MLKKFKIQSRKISFKGSGGRQLAASFDFPVENPPGRYILISHCFTCTKQTLTTARLSRGLAQAGFAVLRFDFSGLGDSEGDFADTHFRSMIEDIECAAGWLVQHYQPASVLIGHSMGGTASLAAACNVGALSEASFNAPLAQLEKLVTLASPAEPAHVLHHFGSAMQQLQRGEEAEIQVAGQAYTVKPAFVDDVQSYDMAVQMHNCELPILVIRAGNDELVGPQDAQQIMAYGNAQSVIYDIDRANHLFSDRNHAQQLLSEIVSWIS